MTDLKAYQSLYIAKAYYALSRFRAGWGWGHSIFSVCLGWGYIPLYKFWEEAQMYLSGKGLISYLFLESEYHKFPELVLMIQ